MRHTPFCENTGLRIREEKVNCELDSRWWLIPQVNRWGISPGHTGRSGMYSMDTKLGRGQGQWKILGKAHMLRDFYVVWMEVFTLGVTLPDQVSWISTETPTWEPGHLCVSPDPAISKKASLEASSLSSLPPKWGSFCSTKTLIYRWRIMLYLKRYWVRKWVLFASETR